MELSTLKKLITQIAEERELPFEKVKEVIESALASAYKKEYGKKDQIIRCKIDFEEGKISFIKVKKVVDESMIYTEKEIEKEEKLEGKVKFNKQRHIFLNEAKKINPEIKVGEEIEFPLEHKENYGRIATQTAKQVILQKLKELERESAYKECKEKEGEVISGIIQKIEKNTIFVDIGKGMGIFSKSEQVKNEFYRSGQRMKFYVLGVEKTKKEPIVYLSRKHPKFVTKLFELEVPEIPAGVVEIKSIARNPGVRTKIAVASNQKGLDPVGTLIGQRGTRIMAVINELGGEKIDVITYSDNPLEYISNALSPAKVVEVKIGKKNTALVKVPKDQLSLAIGKDGENVKLASELTNWKIDIKPFEEKNKT